MRGVRACLIHDEFSARQGVEDDAMNVICFGGRVMDEPTCWKLTQIFLAAKYSGAERHAPCVEDEHVAPSMHSPWPAVLAFSGFSRQGAATLSKHSR